jgi:pimeloyl-ACP methyl ester carboxylesterase
VSRPFFLGAFLLVILTAAPASALGRRNDLDAINGRLAGHVVDYTHNHGRDNRLWSAALGERRDLYVYLPPGFDPGHCYPVILWLHGIGEDERSFLEHAVPVLDAAIRCGRLPPVLVAAPDGNVDDSRHCVVPTHSGFLNTKAGRYEDYLFCDVWAFVQQNYPVRPEREAHILGGVSIGGAGAYHLAIKHRESFAAVFGIFPPLNFRWVDCHCNYFGKFDPSCWGWRTSVANGHETVGKFYHVIRIPLRKIIYPLYGRGPDAIARISAENPIEMLDAYGVRPGDLDMYVAVGGRDEFNIDAQVASFLYRARQRGLDVTTAYNPDGRHNLRTAREFAPSLLGWLAPRLAPFSPPVVMHVEP